MLELESINHVALIGNLVQQMCVYLVVAYLLSKTPLFAPLMQVTVRLPEALRDSQPGLGQRRRSARDLRPGLLDIDQARQRTLT